MKVHELKTDPEHFYNLVTGMKNFELRKNDRDYQVGDKLYLKEFDRITKEYSGRSLHYVVNCILFEHDGLAPDYVCMSITRINKP